jgi:hypothetical protein
MLQKVSSSAGRRWSRGQDVGGDALKHRPITASAQIRQARPRPRVRLRTFFANWQPHYAAHNIATFPLHANKQPQIKHWQKVGLTGSAKLVSQFADAGAFGYVTGHRNNKTVLDIDTSDERVLADAIDRHGASPIIVRTASGKFQVPYRYNGERRRIRPWDGLPIDLLGAGGFVVATPSEINGGTYELVQGKLDDLDRLPILKGLQPASNGRSLYVNSSPLDGQPVVSPLHGMRDHDGRNIALYYAIGPQARDIFAAGGTQQQLLDFALYHNRQAAEPMAISEVAGIVGSIWQMTERGDNHIGMHGFYMQARELEDLNGNSDAFYLLAFLRAHQGKAAPYFWIANGLAEKFDWTVKRLAAARSVLLERKQVRRIRRPSQGRPARYVWP